MSLNGIGALGARLLGLRRAVHLLAQRPWLALASAASCAAALFLPLLALNCASAFTPVVLGAKVAPEMAIFVAAGTASAEIKSLQSRVQAVPGVVGVRLIGRDAALSELRGRAPAGAPLPELTPNPLPDVLIAEMTATAARSELDAAAASFRKLPKVDSVQFDADWYRKLASLLRAAGAIGLLIAVWAMALVVVIMVGAVRIQADSSAAELRLLQLVGADASFIRRPYVYAGALVLLTAGLAALGLVMATSYWLGPPLSELAQAYGAGFQLPKPSQSFIGAVLAGCLVWGGLVAWIGTRTAPVFPR